ncbi:MAG: ornithine carbamoyltransferase [Anaerolineae bacterium]|nr:ornithine carbamoyltransferase [Anaerolineae bacterium]
MDKSDFTGRDFLTLLDFTPDEVAYIVDLAAQLKRERQQGIPHPHFSGRTAAMIFEKASTRTRTSFQAACAHLGVDSFYMRPDEMQLSRGEPIKDTARVIDRYCDVLFIRTFGQEIVEEFARYMEHPVINALTDEFHPCQGLADLLTIREKKGHWKGLRVTYAGDVWNVCQTLMIGCAMFGMDIYVVRPPGYDPIPRVLERTRQLAAQSSARVVVTGSLDEAVEGADVIYANTWHSMGGPEKTKEQRIQDFAPYQINGAVLEKAAPDVIFMHCLPGYRGEEMTDEVVEGPHSVVFDQAENRLHTEKAVLYLVLK